ncbi:YihY/virulence factor BrkB family protein [Nesterenkonia salmonea]|uniref:YihY/virulence factor BrkB family protein n=1 Tax=Nesterenkonia salmonea TaxID=1804987 RepID=A0A5R9BFX3_9MICC|nr:YihY/virulence factor BrkB family protein [Nesterenkonia salmonea]TLP99566.1 YihY/virulence factor BrkB family protein [Nesterenkonia salmonea]
MPRSSRLRPQNQAARRGHQRGNTGAILDAAKARVEKFDDSHEVKPRNNPVDHDLLKREELQARMAYGRAKREGRSGTALFVPMLEWWLTRLNRTRAMRSLNLFFFHYGTVMAAGAAYMMFFSVSAMLVAGFSVAGLVISGDEELQAFIVEAVETAVPGVIDTGDGGLARPDQLFDTAGFNTALVVSLLVAIVASLSWIHGLRSGIRSIFDRPLMAEYIWVVKARDFLIMLVLGAVLAATTAANLITTVSLDATLGFLGWEALDGPVTRLAAIGVSFVLDVLVAILVMRVASRIVIPVAALWQVAIIAGVGSSLLRQLSTQLISNATSNDVLLPFATVLGLFFYFYLFSLVYLMAASWGAIVASDQAVRS